MKSVYDIGGMPLIPVLYMYWSTMRIHEVITPTKPPTPEQARIRSMQAQVKRSQTAVKQERIRQQQTKLNQARAAVSAST